MKTLGYTSHPSRGAWIEIVDCVKRRGRKASHPSRGAWIEMVSRGSSSSPILLMSHPSRGAWIEIWQRSRP